MAIFYSNQGYIETLSVKTGVSSYRLSEQRQILFGGRGTKYDEFVYLTGQNGSSETVDRKLSDSWTKFGPANSAAGSRADQIKRDFCENGVFP